jgi:hypothetical protein
MPAHGHVGLGADPVGLQAHSAGLTSTVADVAGIAAVTGDIPGSNRNDFVSQEQALNMFRAALANAQQGIRDEVQELWNTIQSHEATIQSHEATLQSHQATIQNQQAQIDKIRATLSGLGGQHWSELWLDIHFCHSLPSVFSPHLQLRILLFFSLPNAKTLFQTTFSNL